MSTDQKVGLNTNVSQGLGEMSHSLPESRREASDTDRRAFEQAMTSDREGGSSQAEGGSRPAAPLLSPFALLGGQAMSPDRAAVLPADVGAGLAEAASRLMVSDGSAGHRAVRVELKDDVLPGVAVSVFEQEGRVVAAFSCTNERSRERLCQAAQGLADELAESLGRLTRVQVSTDDPDNPLLHEVAGEPLSASGSDEHY